MDELSLAYKFLANYHLKRGNLEEAYIAAQKCTEFDEVCTYDLFVIYFIL